MRDTLSMRKSDLFLEHSINVALVSLAVASSPLFNSVVKNDRSSLIDICKTGILFNYGALSRIDDILKL